MPPVNTTLPRDVARLGLASAEREIAVGDADWLRSRLSAVNAAIVDPSQALLFSAI